MQKEIDNIITDTFDKVDKTTGRVVQTAESIVKPYRDSALRRFPVLFTFLATFGLVAVFLGFEQLIMKISLFANHPVLILFIGVVTLTITGTLYKKLG